MSLLVRWTRAAIGAALLLVTLATAAQVPNLINYQGFVAVGGASFTGSGQFRFAFVDAAGTTTYWSNDGTSVGGGQPTNPVALAVSGGVFNATLGGAPMTSIPATVFTASGDVRLRVWFDDGTNGIQHLVPDQRIVAGAYAIRAGSADALAASASVPAVQITGTVSNAQIADGSVTKPKLSAPGGSAGQVLGTDGSNLQWQSAGGAGTVTQVNTGTGLTGGPITSSGTVSIANGGVGNTQLANASVDVPKLNTTSTDARYFMKGGNTFGATAILGTTDNNPIEINVNGARVMRYQPAAGSPSIVGGLVNNSVAAGVAGATVSGGGVAGNTCYDPLAGAFTRSCANQAMSDFAITGGGVSNAASGISSTVAGGQSNEASGLSSFIGGGFANVASGGDGTIAGGRSNIASGDYSTVAGGYSNTASGFISTVAGGGGNTASGDYSFAAGFGAKTQAAGATPTIHHGTFVFADNTGFDFNTATSREFAVRATGGVRFVTAINGGGNPARTVKINGNGEADFGSDLRQMLNLWGPASYGIGVQSTVQYSRSDFHFAWYQGGAHSDSPFDPGTGGLVLMTLTSGASSSTPTGFARAQLFTSVSDRNAKTAFLPVDPKDVLRSVNRLPIATWSFKNEMDARHIGPVAQDFHAAFGVGNDDRTISTVDEAGVALAAIQGLSAKVDEQAAALADRDGRIAALEAQLADLRNAVELLVARGTSDIALARR
jgi:hypothetical protein